LGGSSQAGERDEKATALTQCAFDLDLPPVLLGDAMGNGQAQARFASVIFVPLAQWLVQLQGWRVALVTLALLLAIITIPVHALVLRRQPEDLGLAPDGIAVPTSTALTHTALEQSVSTRAALHGATFWWITTAFALTMLVAGAITIHLVGQLANR